MNKKYMQLQSLILVFAVTLSCASCGKDPKAKKEGRKITEDTPWFNANIIEVDTGVDKDRNIGASMSSFTGSDEDLYVIYTGGMYALSLEEEEDVNDYETYTNNYSFDFVSVIDRKTSQTINVFDPTEDFTASDVNIKNISYIDGVITVRTNLKERDYDPYTGDLLDTRSINSDSFEDDSNTTIFKVGDYKFEVTVYQLGNMRRNSTLKCVSPDGKTESYKFDKQKEYSDVTAVLSLNDTTALVIVDTDGRTDYYELDLVSGELILADSKEYDWIDSDISYDSFSGNDGMLYLETEDGISRLNTNTKTTEKIFDYNWCDLNRGLLYMKSLIECSADYIVIGCEYKITSIYDTLQADTYKIIELTRADKNPNAGKTVLELYDLMGVNAYTGEAVSEFNRSSDEYFIEITNRYNRHDFFDNSLTDIDNDDIYAIAKISGGEKLSNKLAIDIMNGEGPDILVNTGNYGQLNNPGCLADLSPYVDDSDNYFTNIIEGSKTGGVLYQMPVSFNVEGIFTKTKYAGESGRGFTLDEYINLVDEATNGYDPITFGQAVYFTKLFSFMSDMFISDGKVDLSGPEFKELADYVRDNVPEDGTGINIWYESVGLTGMDPMAEYTTCTGIGGFYNAAESITSYGIGATLFGLPSLDGRGPLIEPVCSVAISAQAKNIDACGEFVKILLSEDIQTAIAKNDCFVINRDAFKSAGESAIEYYNSGGCISMNGNGLAIGFGPRRELTQKEVDVAENMLLTCSGMNIEDSSISIILLEEMPAYFTGQKDLDSVISIASDRIQKVLDERGF